MLGVGTGQEHPAGIQEGVIATKGYVIYWTALVPLPTVNANHEFPHPALISQSGNARSTEGADFPAPQEIEKGGQHGREIRF